MTATGRKGREMTEAEDDHIRRWIHAQLDAEYHAQQRARRKRRGKKKHVKAQAPKKGDL